MVYSSTYAFRFCGESFSEKKTYLSFALIFTLPCSWFWYGIMQNAVPSLSTKYITMYPLTGEVNDKKRSSPLLKVSSSYLSSVPLRRTNALKLMSAETISRIFPLMPVIKGRLKVWFSNSFYPFPSYFTTTNRDEVYV